MTEHTQERLRLSSRSLDTDEFVPEQAELSQRLLDVADGVAMVETLANVAAFRTDDGLFVVDTGMIQYRERVIGELRAWHDAPVTHIVYTHGHVDHVGGSPAFVRHNAERGHPAPQILAHPRLVDRLERYWRSDPLNLAVNRRQFGLDAVSAGDDQEQGLLRGGAEVLGLDAERYCPRDVVKPDVHVTDRLELTVGGERFEVIHDRAETDDALWVWAADRGVVCAGDSWIWHFPNAGNPQKALRFPRQWGLSLREMARREPEILLPGHGLPMVGRDRIQRALLTVADALESMDAQVLELMNAGATLDEVLQRVKVPDEILAKPYMRPSYDDPEFLIHNIWRDYGGWWDGDPAHLKPAPRAELAGEITDLVGGPDRLRQRALELLESGRLRSAAHLVELAAAAAPDDPAVHDARIQIYDARVRSEPSQMARGIFATAAQASRDRLAAIPA